MAELKQNIDLTISKSKTAEMIDDAWFWQGNKAELRPYLGVSLIGHHCSRYLWLNFRWFSWDVQDGRMLRLFRRGQREEETVVSDLRMIGMELDYVLDRQLDMDFGCHVKGHPDGLILSGVPEAPKSPHTLEIKTHNRDSFNELEAKGVMEAKPMHYAQMQCEMLGASLTLGLKIERALYVAVSKDDDRMYSERIRLDKPYAQSLIKRGQDIAVSDYIPSPISTRPDWWQCRFCRFHDLCHGGTILPEIHCRTCIHFTAEKDGRCTCACYGGKEIPLEAQRKGCPCHVFHPDMVPSWELVREASTKDSACYRIPELGDVLNGWEGYSSEDIKAAIGRGEHGTEDISAESDSIDF